MSRGAGTRILSIVAIVIGALLLGWGFRTVKLGDEITPPPDVPAALATTVAQAAQDSETGVRHGYTQFPEVAVMGDTFATGYGTDRGRGWVEQLGTAMCWSIPSKSVEAETGYTSPGGSATTSIFRDRVSKITQFDPRVVIVEGGGFDFAAPPELIYKNAADVFQLLRSELPEKSEIFAVGPVASPAVNREQLGRITTAIADAARDTGVTFIDPVAEGWLPDATYFFTGNNLLPNDRGHAEYAKRFAEDLRERGVPAGCG